MPFEIPYEDKKCDCCGDVHARALVVDVGFHPHLKQSRVCLGCATKIYFSVARVLELVKKDG